MKIFSINETESHLVIYVLGIKFKIKTNKMYPIGNLFSSLVFRFCKVKKNKVVFANPCTLQYSCNVKYIIEELLKRSESKNLDLVWLCSPKTNKTLIPSQFRFARYNSLKCFYELLTSKVWISNSHMILPIKHGVRKPKDTIYFQTFHGTMGIKKIDCDSEEVYEKIGLLKWLKLSASHFDYLFSDSECEKNIFKSAFAGHGEVVKLGKARDSIFYKNPIPYIQKVKEFYDIPSENKILLYAPTWRDDKRYYVYNIDINLLKKVLKQRFGGDWTVLIRAHYLMRQNIFNTLYNRDEVINCNNYPDMQELLVASDVLISDYSSCVPEYTILKKPSFLYTPDYEYYCNNSNGFYYPLSTLPSPLAKDNYELAENILNFDDKAFKTRAEVFLQQMGHSDDENSPKRIVDFILQKSGLEAK